LYSLIQRSCSHSPKHEYILCAGYFTRVATVTVNNYQLHHVSPSALHSALNTRNFVKFYSCGFWAKNSTLLEDVSTFTIFRSILATVQVFQINVVQKIKTYSSNQIYSVQKLCRLRHNYEKYDKPRHAMHVILIFNT